MRGNAIKCPVCIGKSTARLRGRDPQHRIVNPALQTFFLAYVDLFVLCDRNAGNMDEK